MLSLVALHGCFRPLLISHQLLRCCRCAVVPPACPGEMVELSLQLFTHFLSLSDTLLPEYISFTWEKGMELCEGHLVKERRCLPFSSSATCSGMMMSRNRWSLCCVLLAAASSVLHQAAAARSLLTSSELQTSLRSLTQATTSSAATSPIAEFVRNGGPVPSKGAVTATSKPDRPGHPKEEKDHKLYLYAW